VLVSFSGSTASTSSNKIKLFLYVMETQCTFPLRYRLGSYNPTQVQSTLVTICTVYFNINSTFCVVYDSQTKTQNITLHSIKWLIKGESVGLHPRKMEKTA
jgi:hypothetical protein